MLETLLPWIAIGIGFIGLIWSADRFVEGSASAAAELGVSKLMIGLTIVAFGTSAPEVIVSISSSLQGAGELAVGNALGSNLANIGMVLGVTALIAALPIKGHILKQEFTILLGFSALAGFFLFDAYLSRWEGIILVFLILPLLIWIAHSKKEHPEELEEIEEPEGMTMAKALLWFAVGLVLLILSAETLVWGAKTVALSLGISPLVVGLTIVAVGTSLPELAASIASALKGHHDIAIGNVIGSNIFNLLLVMGIAPIFSPITLEDAVFKRDFLMMMILTLTLGAIMWLNYIKSRSLKQSKLGKLGGIALLLLYGYYYTLLF